MITLFIDKNGKNKQVDISRKELTREFDVHTRDLRPVFAKNQAITIAPRGDCIIVNFHSVKLVVGKHVVYVFDLENKKVTDYFLPFLLEKIKSPAEKIRFEHLVIEIALAYIVEKMERRFDEIERASDQIFGKLKKEQIDDQTFEQLLHLKKRLSKLSTKVHDIEDALEELVEDDDELLDFYLGMKKPTDTEDAESVLENALEQIEDITHRVEELDENIDDTQEVLTLKMNNLRNIIIKFDLILTAATGVLGILAVIVGFYGMNIRNHMEQDPSAIWGIAIALFIIFSFGLGALLFYLKKKRVM
ncbi:CorA family magnesium transporter [Candidatus Gracilibacteria bacterium]|nr:CorA family magnesium transporter [Candidatus Gracilibacteria bacterium]